MQTRRKAFPAQRQEAFGVDKPPSRDSDRVGFFELVKEFSRDDTGRAEISLKTSKSPNEGDSPGGTSFNFWLLNYKAWASWHQHLSVKTDHALVAVPAGPAHWRQPAHPSLFRSAVAQRTPKPQLLPGDALTSRRSHTIRGSYTVEFFHQRLNHFAAARKKWN